MTKPKTTERANPVPQKAPPAPPPPTAPAKVAPLFRKIDWLTLLITIGVVWTVYFLTLAPELTLEDSGELVTGSFYAGIPHPPGYPVWTIYSWLWTVLLPVGSIAWRVGVGEATAAAIACGLLAFIVSRGSSLFIEGIEELKGVPGKWENAICLVSGFAAGVLMGLDGFMWRESVVVNRIALFSVPWLLLVLTCLLRWIYAPHQLRYAYWAAFIFGVCFTTHQSLITAAIAFEVTLAAGNPRLGRDAFLGNFILYAIYNAIFLSTGHHLFANIGKPGLFFLFNLVGIGSLLAGLWLAFKTKGRPGSEWLPVVIMALLWVLGVCFYFYMPISGMTNPPMQWGYPRTVEGFFHALSRGQYEQPSPTNVLGDPGRFLSQLWMLISGVAEEFTLVYMFVALVPFLFYFKMQKRERAWLIGLTAMYLCLGVLLIILLNPQPDRASADLIKVFLTSSHTLVACLIGYGLALTAAFMATNYARFRFWGILGGIAAALLALVSLWDTTGKHYFGPAGQMNPVDLAHWVAQSFAKNQYGLPIYASLLLVGMALAFVAALVVYRRRGPLLITLALFSVIPVYSGLSHWFGSEQRGHWFGYWFGHDMFTPPFAGKDGKPFYPEMTKDAVLFGGTDPGRFCPTYMVFCESFTPHNCQPVQDQKFDRRDIYIITQNALADGTYLDYIRAHYNRSAEIDPPFFSEFVRTMLRDKDYQTNILARAMGPLDRFFTNLGDRVEKRRRTYTSWFTEMDFIDLPAFAAKLRTCQDALSKYVFENLSPETQRLVAGKGDDLALRKGLAKDLNVLLDREQGIKKQIAAKQREKGEGEDKIAEGNTSESLRRRQEQLDKEIAELTKVGPLYVPERFKDVRVSEYLGDFIKENPQSHTRIRLNRLLLEAAYPKELVKSLGGVYPDREIYIPSPEDSQRCFQEYTADASRRLQHDMQFPNEPKQIKGGEDVHVIDNRVQVSGTIAVMNINGLLTKVIFDHCPKNEFFVEESFPLDWMYPYLTPYGVIMKINRQPLPTLTGDILQRDHQFWKEYSKRLCGDIIDYGTPIKQVTDWIEKTYLRRDFNGFTGDRKFVRDSDGQKAFSKLRSSIGGIYAWRLNPQVCPPEYRPKSDAEVQALMKEAEFSLLQAFAFCPYSPEAIFRYATLLAQFNRIDDALLIANTCLKIDPYNGSVIGLRDNLLQIKQSQGQQQRSLDQVRVALQHNEEEVRKNPANYQAAFDLARDYLQLQQSDRAIGVLDNLLNQSNPPANVVLGVAQAYGQLGIASKLEVALEKLIKAAPESPEAWYDLAAFKASVGKLTEALPELKQALILSAARLKQNPKSANLVANARSDERFKTLRASPEFQKLVAP